MKGPDLVAIITYADGCRSRSPRLHRRSSGPCRSRCTACCIRRTTTLWKTPLRLRPERRRVQHLQHRPPARRAADRGEHAERAQGEEVADLLRQRTEPQRRRQPGAASSHAERRASRERGVLSGGRARTGGDATDGRCQPASPGGIGMYTGATAMASMRGLQRSQDALYTLAADTGGKALLDSNDLSLGIVRAQQAASSYYILGLLPDEHRQGRQAAPREDHAQESQCRALRIASRITPTRSSASSPPPTRNGSSKRR